MNWKPTAPAVQALIDAMLAEVNPVYVVGGVVRDALLGNQKKQTDIDLVIDQPALPIARRVADRLGWAYYPLDEARDVARLVFTATPGEPYVCDIASIRGVNVDDDLRSRDFSINAMAFAIRKPWQVELVDVTGGEADLAARVLRRVTPMSLAEDPLRLLRAIRFMVQFGLDLDPKTSEQIRRLTATIKLVSPERLRDELWKAMTLPKPDHVIKEMGRLGLLDPILPEVAATIGVDQSFPHYTDVYDHTIGVIRCAAEIRGWLQASVVDDPPQAMWQATLMPWCAQLRRHFLRSPAGGRQRVDWLIWYALFHDVGKARTRSEELQPDGSIRYHFYGHEEAGAELTAMHLEALRFSRAEIGLGRTVVAAHMRPHHLDASFLDQDVSRRAMFRFFRDTGSQAEEMAGIDTLLQAVADYQAIYEAAVPPRWDEYLAHIGQLLAYAFSEDGWRRTQQEPLVDGFMLMQALNLPPGRHIGVLLGAIMEAQAAGDVTTREAALELAKVHMASAEER